MKISSSQLQEQGELLRRPGQGPGLVPVAGLHDGGVEAGVGPDHLPLGLRGHQPPMGGGDQKPRGGKQQQVGGGQPGVQAA